MNKNQAAVRIAEATEVSARESTKKERRQRGVYIRQTHTVNWTFAKFFLEFLSTKPSDLENSFSACRSPASLFLRLAPEVVYVERKV